MITSDLGTPKIELDTSSGENLYNHLNCLYLAAKLDNKTIFLTWKSEQNLEHYTVEMFKVPILLMYWFACDVQIDHRLDAGLQSFVK